MGAPQIRCYKELTVLSVGDISMKDTKPSSSMTRQEFIKTSAVVGGGLVMAASGSLKPGR